MKHILLIVSNETAAILMSSLILNQKNNKFDLIIEKSFDKKNNVEDNIIKIFDKIIKNETFILNKSSTDCFFYLQKIFSLPKIIKENKVAYKYINKKLVKIKLTNYDEIWFSHEHCARFLVKKFKGIKQRYFFHGYGDINLLRKKNLFKNIKTFFEIKINEIFFNNTIPVDNKKVEYYNFFNKYYNKSVFKLPKIVSAKNYIKTLNDFSKKFNFKIYSKKCILISGNLPTFKNKTIFKKFIFEYTNLIKDYIPVDKDFIVIIKEKNNIFYSKEFKNCFYNTLKKLIPNKIIIFNEIYKYSVPFEILALKLKPKIIISQLSTSDFILSKILKKTKYLSVKKFLINFYKKNNVYSKNFLSDKRIINNGFYVQNNISKPKKIKFI